MDGLYSFSEYKTLKPELGDDMIVIAITCSRPLRYQRLAERPDRPLTTEQARERDFQEIEKLEKGGPIAIADYTLLNNGSPDQLLAQLDSLLEQLNIIP